MLLNIDPRDNESLEQGTQFIKEFNDSLSQFSVGATKIEKQIKNYFSINPEDEEVEHESADNNGQSGRVIRELDKSESHTLDENFTYQKQIRSRGEGTFPQRPLSWDLQCISPS
ncbi:MAG: hypothetical protein K8R75_03105 [Deltaproteobacteria bacterium]|nr:hypothetical protein [Deltaproteobacteria bacterium]